MCSILPCTNFGDFFIMPLFWKLWNYRDGAGIAWTLESRLPPSVMRTSLFGQIFAAEMVACALYARLLRIYFCAKERSNGFTRYDFKNSACDRSDTRKTEHEPLRFGLPW